jgi:competence protein ComEC
MGWQWDGVAFRVLNPPAGPVPQRQSDNDGSCVLLVTAGERRVLLPGDISARVERRLEVPRLDLLLSPHHGSRTSSSRALIERTQPRYVLVEAPRRSRYGHPHEDVLARYRAAGAGIYITGHHGALVWESDRPEEVVRWRQRHGAYWHERASEGSPDRQPAAGN